MNITSEKLVFFGNNYVGFEVLSWLLKEGYNVIYAIIHRHDNAYYLKEIKDLLGEYKIDTLYFDEIETKHGIGLIKNKKPTIGVSAYYGYILSTDIISLFPLGIINIHGGYLPWCRGRNPNVWAIVDNTPAGASIHLINEKIDGGKIIAQHKVSLTPEMNAKDLHFKIEQAALRLFFDSFSQFLNGKIIPKEQSKEGGTHHYSNELQKLKKLDLSESTTVGTIINRLRACTFPPYPSAYFSANGEEYEVSISIKKKDPKNTKYV